MVSTAISKLYQLSRLITLILYTTLLGRWIGLIILVDVKFLPGGIHEFLCNILVFSSALELFWMLVVFHYINWFTLLKNLNFIYIVVALNFWDDYEHAPLLKTYSYSIFIIGLSLSQMYCHWRKLFKSGNTNSKSLQFLLNKWIWSPSLYISEYYLLLLNMHQYRNFHNTLALETFNKIVVVIYLPILLFVAFQKL
ncbi:Keg1p SCDLUD_002282 [Saccharomycodes ludwigii]|uniref:Keg1p n=1 Tax=Saccharomycodes ludwigii TaxID=36035 RepID=UPI001E83E1C6|nr:hypothetical protein SCDLUD_002282 [Saccharomycodes ludwigii]KAH3900829.1 hypothetical protein SCDLUD_002282 [Saccharomycodes ludwigii]